MSFTDSVKKAVHIAQAHAKDFSHNTFGPAHLLKALLHKDVGIRSKLESSGKDIFYMEEWADVRIETYAKGRPDENPKPDAQAEAIFAEADNIRLKFGTDDIDALHLLISLATPGVGFTYEQLKTFGLTANELIEDAVDNSTVSNLVEKGGAAANGGSEKKAGNSALLKFCTDKTADARTGKIDEIIGRDKEIRMMAEILGRRSKPNVIIVGEPGVGKSSLVDGFALNVVNGHVPDNLKNVTVFELDFGSLVAGASYKGEVEDRLKNIVKELKQFDKAILYIDEIHQLLDKNGGASGAANLLKPELARGELTVIGATTNEEYRKYIESDDAFSRRFEVVRVEEPDDATAVRMLGKIIPYYEKHHSLTVDKDAAPEAIRLARRFAKERSLPDAAIDLLDRTMASVKFAANTATTDLKKLGDALNELLSKKEELDLLAELKWFHKELNNKVSHVLTGQLDDETDINTLETADAVADYLKDVLARLTKLAEDIKSHVDKTDIAAMIAHKTGIPIGKLGGQERERLMGMEAILQKRVVGQDHAIKSLSEAILEARSGLNKQGQPIGSFFLLGPTGTGKTEVAKSLAEFLFQTESAMIRFDMSEFKEEHSAALLYGAPPGYVGYEEGGVLVNKIRQQPYAIVLFDEIEKAHPSVFDIFLQILDEGKMHDRLGKEGDFSNAVILFTSNIGAENIIQSFAKDIVPKSSDLLEIMANHFRPEFLARLTEIVPFAPISEKNVVKIFEIHVKSLHKSLERQGITLEITPEAKEKIALMGFTPRYGARPLTGMIRTQLRRPLSRMIIAGEIGKGSHVKVSVDGGELKWEK
jgi:ATP-dependent Clp protease ATP-binding subunit ClpB